MKFVKSFITRCPHIQRAQTIQIMLCIVRCGNLILRSPEGRSDYGRCNGNTHNGTDCFSARKRYFASPSTLFSTIFSLARESGTKQQTSEAFAVWRGRAAQWTRPAACGGARDMELARTSRRRHSCGVTAITVPPVHPEKSSAHTQCTQIQTRSPTRLHVVQPVIFAFVNCPIKLSAPVMRTSRPPSVRAVSSSPSLPSTSTRIVRPTYA